VLPLPVHHGSGEEDLATFYTAYLLAGSVSDGLGGEEACWLHLSGG